MFMGIDIGTSSVKTLLTNENGEMIDLAQREYEVEKPGALYAEQDMDLLWEKTKETVREISGRGRISGLKGIGFSGQMHGLVMIDKNGHPVRKAILWCDQRSAAQKQLVYEVYGEQKYRRATYNDLSSGFLFTSLLWVKQHDRQAYEKIDKVILPKDYIRYRICGELATDYSDASATLLFDTAGHDWAWELVQAMGFRFNFFPPCFESHEVAGYVTQKCSMETGLPYGIPVVYGGGDSIMQQLGNGVIDAESPWIANIGTSCSVNCAVDSPVYDREFRTNTFCHAAKGRWFFMGANLCGGAALKWLKNNILHLTTYEELSSLADTVEPGSGGLLFLPYLSGSRTPVNDPDAQGMFFGLTMSHDRAHLTRSVMEGIILGMYTTFHIFEEEGLSTKEIIASGGGARSRVFLQMEADIFRRPVRVAQNSEQSCLGAAITAAVGTGHFSDYHEACESMVKWKDLEVLPRHVNFNRYEEAYAVYRELYDTNRELLHQNHRRIQ